MNTKFLAVLIGTWLLFMVIAIINAAFRTAIYKPAIGDLYAHQLSTVIFIVLILLVTYLVFRFSKISLTDSEAFIIGILWLIFTICFEFLAGHFVFSNTWEKLLGDYNLLAGRIWILVLVTLLFAPYITKRFLVS